MKNSIKYNKIHMIGIGGISMSGIAQILLKWGYKITGSDRSDSDMVQRLIKAGAEVSLGHNENNITDQDLIIYTAAISKDNPELVKAKELGIKAMERADFLGELTKLYPKTIAISGTHGKTTTSSMISLCFLEANLDPAIQIGTILPQINENYRVSDSEYFVIEACEYVDSFLKFYPYTEIILNIEAEHLDYFKDINAIYDSFIKFTEKLPTNGNLIINIDDNGCNDIIKRLRKDINIITYSIKNPNADIYAFDIHFKEDGCAIFDVKLKDKEINNIELNIIGLHNVSNACACIATCLAHNIKTEVIKQALNKFQGSQRRFEFKGLTKNNSKVYDDYAHHPTEIKAILSAVKKMKHNKIITVFQPHTYSRVKTLFKDFITAFEDTDELVITDIYAAREMDDGAVSSDILVKMINESYPNKATYISNFENIVKYLDKNSKEDDLILLLGAGTIVQLSKQLVNK